MKKKILRLLALIIIALSLSSFNIDAVSYRGKAASYKSTVVRNYSQFYSTLKSGIASKKSQVTIYAKSYNKSTYDIDKAVKQALENSFDLKYTLSSYNARISGVKGSRDRTLSIQLKYRSVDGTAKDYAQLLKTFENAAKNKKSTVTIKVRANNTSVINNGLKVKDDSNKILPLNSRIGSISIYKSGFPKVNELLLTYNITYKDETKTSGTSLSASAKSYDDLYKTIKNAIYNYTSSVSISFQDNYLSSSYQNIINTINKITNEILNNDLDINYVNGHRVQVSQENGVIKANITFNYLYTRDKVIQERNETDKKAAEIIKTIIKPDMTDYQKELAIHNYIINNARYDTENYERGTLPPESFTSYGVLVKGVGVCQSYATAMKKLLNLAGIESIIVTGYGDGEPHAWNLVKIGGNYYHVDATWDDPVYTVNGVRKNVLRFDYFNLTDSEMSKDHKWDKSIYPACNSTEYSYKNK